ncbi:MAG: response regulator [Steroidobacteraceae bacterium]
MNDFHGRAVLLVEDNDQLRRVLSISLRALGFDVCAAADADEARTLLTNGLTIDLLLSDVRMQSADDGAQLARWVAEQWPATRVLLQTGYAEGDTAGFPVINKPFNLDELRAKIASILVPA